MDFLSESCYCEKSRKIHKEKGRKKNEETWVLDADSAQLELHSLLCNSLAFRTRARDHVDTSHVMLTDISENGIILT